MSVARPRRPGSARRGRDGGFTLIELMIAITLMAVLAVLGWRGLDSVLVSRERIVDASDNLRALSVAFAQIEEDLRRAWPVRLLNLPVPAIAFVAQGPDAPPAVQMLRELPPGSGPSQVQRVVYRLNNGVFERGFARWGIPSTEPGAQPVAQTLIWQPLVTGVAGLQMRGWIAGQGWVPANALAGRPGGTTLPGDVTGVELLIERGSGERIVRIFAVKD